MVGNVSHDWILCPGPVLRCTAHTADLCEQAAALLKSHATDFSAVSPDLRKFIALSSSLYEARAKASLAKQEQIAENMGLALANLKVGQPICIFECIPCARFVFMWMCRKRGDS